MHATSFNDDWFVTSDIGAHIYIDPDKDLSVGITRSHINEFGPARARWSRTSGDINLDPGLFQELVHGIHKAQKRSLSFHQDQ